MANRVGGTALQLDITAADAGAAHRRTPEPGTAASTWSCTTPGITRDKLLANMDADRWGAVLEVNLRRAAADQRRAARAGGAVRDGGRDRVRRRRLSGIAGNRGQINYAASKAGVIGMVGAQAPRLAARGITYNAVAPGFIETEMTGEDAVGHPRGRPPHQQPAAGRPAGRRRRDDRLARPAESAGVTGQVVRVCGQSLLGA